MSTGTQGVPPPPAQGSKMLLDSPAPDPALGFGPIAEAFASIIEASEPRFAIGIFGDWGSGKTTLMNTIERKLDRETAIPVRFNAWRYEREPELLVPLLDTIRQSLVGWAAIRSQGAPTERTEKARMAARRIGRVVRALAAGASVEVGLPGAKLRYDAVKAVDQLRDPDSSSEEDQPQSLYFGGFTELSEAVEEFRSGDITRIVVFVDDLDRCLPSNAIQVLETMKLFFDLPGFVFVVGLDQHIIERAVASRFASSSSAATDAGVPSARYSRDSQIRIAGEYLKKLFQVPYSLNPVLLAQLDELLEAMYTEAALESGQVDDLRSRVQPYLQYVAGDERVNPREIKRFINTYTLQTLVRPDLDRNVVLALQTIAFHPDWQAAYDMIVMDWASFREALERHRTGNDDGLGSVWPTGNVVPSDFLRYAGSNQASSLVEARDLEPYLSSLQTTGSTPGWIQPAYRAVGELRRILGQLQRPGRGDQLASEIGSQLSTLTSWLPTPANLEDPQLVPVLGSISTVAAEIATIEKIEEAPDRVAALASKLDSNLTQLERELRFLRRRASFYPSEN
jgi:hypothetical protein